MSENINTQAPVDAFEIFMNLEDVKGTGIEPETKAQLQSEYEQYKADSDPVIEYGEYEEIEQEEIVDWGFLDKEGGSFEEEAPQEEDVESIIEDTEATEVITDDTEIDYPDTYDVGLETLINLPDGRVMTVEELQNGYQASVDYNAREAAIAQREEDFNARYEAAKDTLTIAELETDRILKSYENIDWDALAIEDPTTYAAEDRYYRRMQARKQDIINQSARIKQQQAENEANAFREASIACVDVLKAAIPNWGDPLYEKLMNHVVDKYKIDPEKVLKWNDPSLFMMAYDSFRRDNGKAMAMASIKGGRKSTGGFVSSKANVAKANNAKADAERKYAQGKLSQQDAFAFLED